MTAMPKILSEDVIYEGYNRFAHYELQTPGFADAEEYGAPRQREVLHTHDSVVVLIYAPEADSFLLCREYRLGVAFNAHNGDDPFIYQCVAGSMDKDGAAPEEIARMETVEEAGVEVEHLTRHAAVYASPGMITEKTHIFSAEIAGTPETGLHGLPEEGEQIATELIKRADAYRMMDEGRIIDSMTLLALLLFRQKNIS